MYNNLRGVMWEVQTSRSLTNLWVTLREKEERRSPIRVKAKPWPSTEFLFLQSAGNSGCCYLCLPLTSSLFLFPSKGSAIFLDSRLQALTPGLYISHLD